MIHVVLFRLSTVGDSGEVCGARASLCGQAGLHYHFIGYAADNIGVHPPLLGVSIQLDLLF
jgi:hypothetical protein